MTRSTIKLMPDGSAQGLLCGLVCKCLDAAAAAARSTQEEDRKIIADDDDGTAAVVVLKGDRVKLYISPLVVVVVGRRRLAPRASEEVSLT
jgi:hypothetical protein